MGLLIGVTETLKQKVKKQEGGFLEGLLAHLVSSLVQPVISSLVKSISQKRVRRAERAYIDKHF